MSFLGRILGKRAGPIDPEGWQVGDWAECVVFADWKTTDGQPNPGPRHGQIMRVIGVRSYPWRRAPGGRVLALAFTAWPGNDFQASAFRKLTPRADEATAAEAEFTALVRRKPAPAMPRETIEEFQ